VQSKLEALEAKSREFNASESLCDLPLTDYKSISKMTKAFEPFQQLWSSAALWLVPLAVFTHLQESLIHVTENTSARLGHRKNQRAGAVVRS